MVTSFVRSLRQGESALPFLAKLDLDADTDARRARRFVASRLSALVVGSERRFEVVIHDISETGFLAEFPSELVPGDLVRLRLARIGFVDARVVRKRGFGHGCEFLEPVPADVVQATIADGVHFGEPAPVPAPLSIEVEREGYRRRAKRERLSAQILIACTIAAVLILAAALVKVWAS